MGEVGLIEEGTPLIPANILRVMVKQATTKGVYRAATKQPSDNQHSPNLLDGCLLGHCSGSAHGG